MLEEEEDAPFSKALNHRVYLSCTDDGVALTYRRH
jgi:hypothetical protein